MASVVCWLPVIHLFLSSLSLAATKTTTTKEQIHNPRGILDVTAAPYNADSTGTKDVSDILQRAIHDGFLTQQAVFFPLGRYLVSKPIEVRCSEMRVICIFRTMQVCASKSCRVCKYIASFWRLSSRSSRTSLEFPEMGTVRFVYCAYQS